MKAAAEQTAGAYSLIEDLAPKGAGTPLHRHREDDEAFYVLDGEMTFYLGNDEPISASAGSFVHIPGGMVPTLQHWRPDDDGVCGARRSR